MSGAVVWFTGLPSSGKTTLARAVAKRLGRRAVLLDSDEVRATVFPSLGYSARDRGRFYAALAALAALLARQGLVVLVAATANLRAYRARARELAPRFVEVFVDTPREECVRRDAKGLYRAGAKLGRYEPPRKAEVRAAGGASAAAVKEITRTLSPVGEGASGRLKPPLSWRLQSARPLRRARRRRGGTTARSARSPSR